MAARVKVLVSSAHREVHSRRRAGSLGTFRRHLDEWREDIVTIAHEPTSDHLGDRCAHQRVDDFYCSYGIPFFAAVVTTCPQHDTRSRPTRVTLAGDLDGATAPLLRTCIAGIDGNVELDCSGLDFVGVQGVEVLVDARARREHAGATFELVAPPPMLERLLLIVGISSW
jgi:anti-anti-sigma factor